ncbi:MAG TPA: hypothetical protein VKU79_05010 [Thermoplasmataceae archaeon]|nr:hypothetical protein [Thermoplasmatales archaeon AK]HLH86205.1 hypothetical protein [Thermoplasmataceae archaeon]
MRRSWLIVLTLGFALMLPLVATSAVIVNNGIAVSIIPSKTNAVYLEPNGNDYKVANESGFIGIQGNNTKYTNLSVDLYAIPGLGNVTLSNVLVLYNDSTTSNQLVVYINGTLPSGVIMYGSASPLTYNGATDSLTGSVLLENTNAKVLTTSGPIAVKSHGVALYIGFTITTLSSEATGLITVSYSIS